MNIRRIIIGLNLAVLLVVIGLSGSIQIFSGSELDDRKSEVVSEQDTEVIDVSEMDPDQIAEELDPDQTEPNFIVMSSAQIKELRGYRLTKIRSPYDFSTINSTMYGLFAMYKVNGHNVFCIEPGYDVLSAAQKVSSGKSKYSKFSTTSQLFIRKVMSSALTNYQSTANTDYLFAGQLLIWEYLAKHEANVIGNPMGSSNPNFHTSWTIHNATRYNPEISIIEGEINNWNKLPSFIANTSSNPKVHTLQYDSKNDEFSITLTDTNGVWDSKFSRYHNFGSYKISTAPGKNTVKISTKSYQSTESDPIKYSYKPTSYNESYFYDAGQDLIHVGAPEVAGYMAFKTAEKPAGGFKLSKTGATLDGKQTALEGVKFTVTSSTYPNFKKTYTTDKSGKITTANNELEIGNYQITETSAPSAYIANFKQSFKITTDKQMIEINSGKPIINKLYTGKIKISKTGQALNSQDSDIVKLADAEFTIYKEEGKANGKLDNNEKVTLVLSTDNKGEALSSSLPIGSYILKETKAPTGYTLSEKLYPFVIENDGSLTPQVIEIDVVNDAIVGKVKFEKVGVGECEDDSCQVPLDNVEFAIYSDNGDIETSLDTAPIDVVTTNENGVGLSNELTYGDYLIKELSVNHDNYLISDETYPFSIIDHQEIVTINDNLPIENNEKLGHVKIEKRGESLINTDIVVLSSAEYTIYDEDGQEIDILTTNKYGEATSVGLSFGKYKIIETAAPDGYSLDLTAFEFEIGNDNYAKELVLKFKDKPITNQINIKKTDIVTGKELPGAELEIKDLNSNKIVEAWTSTTEEHQFTLKYGKYELCEEIAPKGYIRSRNCIKFNVETEGVVHKLNFENKPLNITMTGSDSLDLLIKFMLLLVIVITLKVIYTQKQNC